MHRVRDRVITKKKDQPRGEATHKQLRRHGPPTYMLEEMDLLKYWHNRFALFSRFDDGIQLDRESWFSVTPERVAKYQAQRLACDVIVDGFCGSGGNAIQFAMTCHRVIAIDIDPVKVQNAQHNARIYGVADRIEFRVADFLSACRDGSLPRANCVFLSPPWGGPSYNQCEQYDIERFLQPVGASVLMREVRRISTNIAIYLPRNSNLRQIVELTMNTSQPCEVHHNYLGNRMVAITAFYGEELVDRDSDNLYVTSEPTSAGIPSAPSVEATNPILHSSNWLSNCENSNNMPKSSSLNNSSPKYWNNWQNYSSSKNLSISPSSLNANVCSVVDDVLSSCLQCSLM